MSEEMNKPNEENAVSTEFTEQFGEFVKAMNAKVQKGEEKKAFIVLSIDKSAEPTVGVVGAVVGYGKTITELIMRVMDTNTEFKNLIEFSVKGQKMFSLLKNLQNL